MSLSLNLIALIYLANGWLWHAKLSQAGGLNALDYVTSPALSTTASLRVDCYLALISTRTNYHRLVTDSFL